MISLLAIAIPSVLILGAVTVMFCDIDSPFGFGLLYQLLAIYFPKAVRTILNFIPGGRFVLSCCTGTYDYVVNKPNPLMQIFFLGLVIGGFAVFVHYGLPMIPNKRLSYIHVPLPFILVLWVLFTFVLASVAPPGFVTQKNYAILEQVYPYDGFVFVKRDCPTCGTPKVARSKHCRMLGKCVEKYDHFCPWINNCVGALNYRYFLLFVGSTAGFLVYGTYVLAQLILWVIDKDRLWEVKFMNTGTKDIVDADWKIILQFMMTSHGLLLFIFILCLIMGITLVCFFLYQLNLISYGTTANENAKWGDIADFYSSKKWEKELAQRGSDYKPDSEVLKIDSDPLSERMLKDFPSKLPPNIYHKGFIANFRDVLWPESLKQKRLHAAKSGLSNASTDKNATNTATKSTVSIADPKETNLRQKDTNNNSASKKSKRNKKKD